jgi:hypothetical protein
VRALLWEVVAAPVNAAAAVSEQVGTHDSLMASAGRYREFIKHQIVDYKPAAVAAAEPTSE